MKVSIISMLFLICAVGFANGQSTKWTIDKGHSKITFGVTHMVISEVTGRFEDYEGSVVTSGDDFSEAKVNLTIQAASVNTDNEPRDKDLRSDHFFNVEKYPTITFVSKSMKKVSDHEYTLVGDLTMAGVTKEVTLKAKYNGMANDGWGHTKAGFKITGEIDRTQFGLKYNTTLDNGGLLIGNDVEITCNVELIKNK